MEELCIRIYHPTGFFIRLQIHRNISKAAKELYISQPAISKSIQKLEESLGTKLFERSSRGVALTDSGELLYTHVKSAFETLTALEKTVCVAPLNLESVI